MASSDISSTRPCTVAESYQYLRSSVDRSFDDLLCDQDANMSSIDKAFTWLENLSDTLSIWAVDVRVRDSSLLKLEGTAIGSSLSALFVELSTELMPSQRLLAAFPSDEKGEKPLETTSVIETTSQNNSSDLKLVLNLLYQLQDSVEPIRRILATYQTGPHYATDKQIEDIYANVQEKSLVSESGKSDKKLTPAATESTECLSETSTNSTAQSTLFPHTGLYSSKKSNEERIVDSKDRPRVKIYDRGHKQQIAFDTAYASAFDSPWAVEERTPLDYIVPKSPKPGVDKEPYEIIIDDSKPRYTKSDSVDDRKKDTRAPNRRKKDARYTIRSPESRSAEDQYVPLPPVASDKSDKSKEAPKAKTYKQSQVPHNSSDTLFTSPQPTVGNSHPGHSQTPPIGFSRTMEFPNSDQKARLERQIAQIGAAEVEARRRGVELAEQQSKEIEATSPIDEQDLREILATPPDRSSPQGENILQKTRLERQIAEGRAAEAERRLKRQQQIEDLERRGRELKQRTEEQRKREASITRRQIKLAERQRKELQAPTNRSSPPPLDSDDPSLAPIMEARRDDEARRARPAQPYYMYSMSPSEDEYVMVSPPRQRSGYIVDARDSLTGDAIRSTILREDKYTPEEPPRRRRSRSISFRAHEADDQYTNDKYHEPPDLKAAEHSKYLQSYEGKYGGEDQRRETVVKETTRPVRPRGRTADDRYI